MPPPPRRRSPRPDPRARRAGRDRPPADRAFERRSPDELGGGQVEGRQAVRELLRARRRRVREVLVADAREAPILDEIADLARDLGVPVRHVSGEQLAARARTEVPQGVLAYADPLVPIELPVLCETGGDGRRPFLVVLDSVTDPYNLGNILRSAVSAGATGAVLARHRAAHVTPTVTKAAAGAIEYLPIALAPGTGAALETLRRAGAWSAGLDEAGEHLVDELPFASEPLALVLGAEGRGLAAATRTRCDLLARVPLDSPIASLNVASAAAVAFFAVARARGLR